ncbi:hypothetical protein Aduo_004934 [Ancylostoma duodenale]
MWFLLQNVYGFTSILLYIIVTYLTVRERRHFSHSFVVLFVVFAVVNILSYIGLYLSLRLPIFTKKTSPIAGLFENFPFPSLLRYIIFLCYYLPYCQNMTILLIIFNRFRAIAFPFSKEIPYEVLLSIIAILILPLPLCYDLLFTGAFYRYRPSLQGHYLISETAHQRERLLYLVVFECAVALFGLLLNGCGILILLRRSASHNRRKEMRLFVVSCICFLFQALNAIVTLCIYLFAWNSRQLFVAMFLLPVCNDLNSLTLPYYFILFNRRIKKCFLELPLCKRVVNHRNSGEPPTKPTPL